MTIRAILALGLARLVAAFVVVWLSATAAFLAILYLPGQKEYTALVVLFTGVVLVYIGFLALPPKNHSAWSLLSDTSDKVLGYGMLALAFSPVVASLFYPKASPVSRWTEFPPEYQIILILFSLGFIGALESCLVMVFRIERS